MPRLSEPDLSNTWRRLQLNISCLHNLVFLMTNPGIFFNYIEDKLAEIDTAKGAFYTAATVVIHGGVSH